MAKPVRTLASTVQTVDMATGKVVKTEGASWHLVPPRADHCQFCAVKHEPEMPHNRDSLYYQTCFENHICRHQLMPSSAVGITTPHLWLIAARVQSSPANQ